MTPSAPAPAPHQESDVFELSEDEDENVPEPVDAEDAFGVVPVADDDDDTLDNSLAISPLSPGSPANPVFFPVVSPPSPYEAWPSPPTSVQDSPLAGAGAGAGAGSAHAPLPVSLPPPPAPPAPQASVLVGSGSYGCVLFPPLPCLDSSKNAPEDGNLYVSKVLTEPMYARAEWAGAENLRRAAAAASGAGSSRPPLDLDTHISMPQSMCDVAQTPEAIAALAQCPNAGALVPGRFPKRLVQLIMPYGGKSLAKHMDGGLTLGLDDVRVLVRAFTGLIHWMAALHDNRIAHFDLSSTNVLFFPPTNMLKLIDFNTQQTAAQVAASRTSTSYAVYPLEWELLRRLYMYGGDLWRLNTLQEVEAQVRQDKWVRHVIDAKEENEANVKTYYGWAFANMGGLGVNYRNPHVLYTIEEAQGTLVGLARAVWEHSGNVMLWVEDNDLALRCSTDVYSMGLLVVQALGSYEDPDSRMEYLVGATSDSARKREDLAETLRAVLRTVIRPSALSRPSMAEFAARFKPDA